MFNKKITENKKENNKLVNEFHNQQMCDGDEFSTSFSEVAMGK